MRFVVSFRNMEYDCSVASSGCGIRVACGICVCHRGGGKRIFFVFGQAAVEFSAHVISALFV